MRKNLLTIIIPSIFLYILFLFSKYEISKKTSPFTVYAATYLNSFNEIQNCRLGISFTRGGARPSSRYFSELVNKGKEIGACSNYQSIYWNQVEAIKGSYDWSVPDYEIGLLAQNNIEPIGRLWFTPDFYSSAPSNVKNTPEDKKYVSYYVAEMDYLDSWNRFVRSAVDRYKDKVPIWLFYHEPHQALYFQVPENLKHPLRGNSNDFEYKDVASSVYRFYIFQRYAAATAKEISPRSYLYFTGFDVSPYLPSNINSNSVRLKKIRQFFDMYMQRPGVRTSFDIIRTVNYSNAKPWEICPVSNDGSGVCDTEKLATYKNSVYDEIVKIRIPLLKQILKEYGLEPKLLFAEGGVNSDVNNNVKVDEGEYTVQSEVLQTSINAYLGNGINRYTVFRLANSGRNDPDITEGQLQWVTLGLYTISEILNNGVYDNQLKSSKPAADSFSNLAHYYNKISYPPLTSPSWQDRYRLPSGPCENEFPGNCTFDARELYQDSNGDVYEYIALRGYMYIGKYPDDNPNWYKEKIKTYFLTQGGAESICNHSLISTPCLIDTLGFRILTNGTIIQGYTLGNIKYGVTKNYIPYSNSFLKSVVSSNTVLLNEDNEKYAMEGGPCGNISSNECYFNTRTFRIVNGEIIETVTRGENLYNYHVDQNRWWSQPLLSIAKFNSHNAPCENRNFCVLDTHAFYKDKNGRYVEEITLGNNLYTYYPDGGYWDNVKSTESSYQLVSTPTPTPLFPSCASHTKGDADCNGTIDIVDITYWINTIRGTEQSITKADFNHDNKVDNSDFTLWLNNIRE